MQEETTRGGTTIRLPDTLHVTDRGEIADQSAGAEGGRAFRRSLGPADNDTDYALAAALLAGITNATNADGLSLHDAFDVEQAPAAAATPSRRRDVSPAPVPVETDSITVAVRVQENELAALLIEQDGIFAWQLPQEPQGELRRRSGGGTERRLTFLLEGVAADRQAGAVVGRRGLVDWVTGGLKGRVRAFVVRWTAGRFVDHLQQYLERSVVAGMIALTHDQPEGWRADPAALPALHLPPSRPARLLLLIHGTFSSTRGSFGAFGVTPEGRAFLRAARQHYGAILAFDHKTLSETPEQNAEAILADLKALYLPAGTTVDRGGSANLHSGLSGMSA